VCAGLCVIYGRLLGKQQTNEMLIGWFIATGQAWAVIEPLQILILAVVPMFIVEDSCAGRCFERVRTVYNEIFA